MSSLREKFVSWLKEQIGCIYVWGGQGETNITEAWIRKKETSERNAERAIAFWKKRIAAGAKHIAAYDCSGLVTVFLLANNVIKSDTTSRGLYSMCNQNIKRNELIAGDLVFRHNGTEIHHVGVYIGNNNVIHSKGRDVGVVQETIDQNGSSYWNRYGRITNLPIDNTTNTGGTNMGYTKYEVKTPYQKSNAILYMQKMLNAENPSLGLTEDGVYGTKTDAAYQKHLAAQGLVVMPDTLTVGVNVGGTVYSCTLKK